MSNFDQDLRPSIEDAQAILSAMPRGHYHMLGSNGRSRFLQGNSFNEALEMIADEPTDQELFEMFNDQAPSEA